MVGGCLDVASIWRCTGLGFNPHDSSATALRPTTSYCADRSRRAVTYSFWLLLYQLIQYSYLFRGLVML